MRPIVNNFQLFYIQNENSLIHNSLIFLAWSWTFYCLNDEKNPVIYHYASNLQHLCIFIWLLMHFMQFSLLHHPTVSLVPLSSAFLYSNLSLYFLLYSSRLLLFHSRELPWEGYVIVPPTSKGSRGRKAADWGNLALGRERPLILIPNRHTSKWSRGRGWGWGCCKTWQVKTDLFLFIQGC